MKIAEALVQRKALKAKIGALAQSVIRGAFEKEPDPNKTMAKFDNVTKALTKLTHAIDTINNTHVIETPRYGKLTLQQVRTLRDTLLLAHTQIQGVESLRSTQTVAGGQEWDEKAQRVLQRPPTTISIVLDLDKARASANQLARDARELDTLLQEANWTVVIDVPDSEVTAVSE